MMYDLVVKNGTVVTANATFEADIGVHGERIAAVGERLSGKREIEARDCYVLPGAIDGHVHFTDPDYAPFYVPTADSFAVGTRAAAFGGVTTVVDFAAPAAGVPLMESLERRLKQADGQAVIDYALNLTLRDRDPARVAELPALLECGVTSVKLFMAYAGYHLDDVTLLHAMEATAARNGLAVVHAENFEVIQELERRLPVVGRTSDLRAHLAARPAVMEAEAVHRAIALAHQARVRLLLYHQTCEEGVREIRLAKVRGQAVFGEVCVAQLVYTSADYAATLARGYSLQTSPPIREAFHQTALWQGLAGGTLDIVSSDHAPLPRLAGDLGSGPCGIEARLALVHHYGVNAGRLSINRWVEVCCTNPARVFGLSRKGALIPGYDADLVVFDPRRSFTFSTESLHSAIDYCSYDGLTVRGFPVTTISRGAVLVEDGQFVGQPGYGRFIARP